MKRFSVAQRVEIMKIYYESSCSIRETFRALRSIYGQHKRPTELTIRRLVQKFESTGSIVDKHIPTRQRNARSEKNIVAVRESVTENPNLSISQRSQQLGISQTSVWRILHRDLGLHSYKIQLTEELKPADHYMRREFTDWVLGQLETDPDFPTKIIFSDEAHFWIDGFVDKHDCQIWGNANPQSIVERSLHTKKVTVWCGFFIGGVIGPYFFETEEGASVAVTDELYRSMISSFLWRELDGLDLSEMWFQQDGVTYHTSAATIALLRSKFNDRIISENGAVNWPPRSCDLTPLDFFLWGHVKSLVYSNNPQTVVDLKANIIRVIGEIRPDLCARVIENWVCRIHSTKRNRGGHLCDIVFPV
ncbi:Transposable element Tc3 transposase [Anthophora retusa]